MESGPSRVNAPLEGPVIPRSRRSLSRTKASGEVIGVEALSLIRITRQLEQGAANSRMGKKLGEQDIARHV